MDKTKERRRKENYVGLTKTKQRKKIYKLKYKRTTEHSRKSTIQHGDKQIIEKILDIIERRKNGILFSHIHGELYHKFVVYIGIHKNRL